MRPILFIGGLLLGASAALAGQNADDLIRALGAERFAARQSAQQQLTELAQQDPNHVLPLAVQHYATTTDPEIRARLYDVMSNVVQRVVLNSLRGYLGIRMQQVFLFEDAPAERPADQPQILIVGIMENSPAAKAGLVPGMGILKLDDEAFHGPKAVENFSFAIRSRPPGTTVRLQVRDGDNLREIPVTLERLPPELEQELNLPAQAQRYFDHWLKEQLQKIQPPGPAAERSNQNTKQAESPDSPRTGSPSLPRGR